jgi:5-methylcytosine-specific restriction endonuclease McrA
MRRIALERGYGKWMAGKSPSVETREKLRTASERVGRDPIERQRRSARAKASGAGKWMANRPAHPKTAAALARSRNAATYEERYGDRAEAEREKRRKGNQTRWEGVPRKPQREKHNGDYRYSEWRKAVFDRDDYTCQECGVRGGQLHAHHVKPWATHPDLRYDVDNGLTLHAACHREVHQRHAAAQQ